MKLILSIPSWKRNKSLVKKRKNKRILTRRRVLIKERTLHLRYNAVSLQKIFGKLI